MFMRVFSVLGLCLMQTCMWLCDMTGPEV